MTAAQCPAGRSAGTCDTPDHRNCPDLSARRPLADDDPAADEMFGSAADPVGPDDCPVCGAQPGEPHGCTIAERSS